MTVTVSTLLRFAERLMFAVVGLLLAVVALTVAARAVLVVYSLIVSPPSQTIPLTSSFLDLVLLVLMLAELIHTVALSLRGVVISATPFLIVGLIAVIRRILVITVQEVQNAGRAQGLLSRNTVEVAILTLVVMAFVFAIHLLQRRPSTEGES